MRILSRYYLFARDLDSDSIAILSLKVTNWGLSIMVHRWIIDGYSRIKVLKS